MIEIYTAPSSATAPLECHGHVLVSGSYGGTYNAYHAGKHGIRGVVLNDAGVGLSDAGIDGLPYLDLVSLPAATADVNSCHIGDGEHMLDHGTISYVNETAARLGCAIGERVRTCAERMRGNPVVLAPMPPITAGARYSISSPEARPLVACLDAAPLLEPSDAGGIMVTGSHAALFRGRPDDVIKPAVYAIFFSDAGVGLDSAGIARLPTLDERAIAAAAVSAHSGKIGNSRSIYHTGVVSYVNRTARGLGVEPQMSVRRAVDTLISGWRAR